jgi:hypothetical protein
LAKLDKAMQALIQNPNNMATFGAPLLSATGNNGAPLSITPEVNTSGSANSRTPKGKA